MPSITTFLRDYPQTSLRGLAALALSETARIEGPTRTSDEGGGATLSWGTRGTAVCRIDPVGAAAGVIGGRINERSTHVVTVPTTATILATDRFVIANRGTFEVTQMHMRTGEGPVSRYEVVQTG